MDGEIYVFTVQLTTSRIGNLARLIHTLAISCMMTIHTTACWGARTRNEFSFRVERPRQTEFSYRYFPGECGCGRHVELTGRGVVANNSARRGQLNTGKTIFPRLSLFAPACEFGLARQSLSFGCPVSRLPPHPPMPNII